jgi:hypothetical protein
MLRWACDIKAQETSQPPALPLIRQLDKTMKNKKLKNNNQRKIGKIQIKMKS